MSTRDHDRFGREANATPRRRVDLNADVGEGCRDEELMPFISSASIACGAHAGDAETMRRTIALALAHGVTVGAHPGFPDRAGFGRKVTTRDPASIEALVRAQLAEIQRAADALGAAISYVKPHGALYNLAAAEPPIACAVARAVRRQLPAAALVLLAGSAGLDGIATEGVAGIAEGFVDRGYLASGALAPRGADGASIDDPLEAARRAVALARGAPLATVDGGPLAIAPATLCLHGDGAHAAAIARSVREHLVAAGFEIAAFAR